MEGPGDYDGIIASIPSLPNIPRAIVTNFGSPLSDSTGAYHPEAAKPLINAGFTCLTESYIGDNPNATPDRQKFTAQQLGWLTSQPVFGVYGNETIADYKQWFGWPGWSVYLAECL